MKVGKWFEVIEVIFKVLKTVESENPRAHEAIKAFVDIDYRFSEATCAKALPQAFDVFKSGLDRVFTEETYKTQVSLYRKKNHQ